MVQDGISTFGVIEEKKKLSTHQARMQDEPEGRGVQGRVNLRQSEGFFSLPHLNR